MRGQFHELVVCEILEVFKSWLCWNCLGGLALKYVLYFEVERVSHDVDCLVDWFCLWNSHELSHDRVSEVGKACLLWLWGVLWRAGLSVGDIGQVVDEVAE